MRNINTILCPVDLSDASRHALDHARVLAGWYKAAITVLHVCSPIGTPTSFALMGMPMPMLTDRERELARGQIVDFIGGESMDVLIGSGDPARDIVAHASLLPADLIIMGTHGLGGFDHLVLGSVTEKVLRKARCPVMTVPPKAPATSKLPFRRVLCPIDFSASSLAALELAASVAREGDADLTILHVFEQSPDAEPLTNRPIVAPEYLRQMEADFTQRLHALVPDYVGGARTHLLTTHGKPYREVIGVATEDSADLIVMGVHGRNALDLMLFGSTTNQVVRRATCPVLTLRQ